VDHPLAPPPPGSPATGLFLAHFGIRPDGPPEAVLESVARAFARIPYENLTKLLKLAAEGSPERARRWPAEVVADHVALGAGGTCFSLPAALLHILRSLGFEAQPLLADRRYGPDTHCALAVNLNGAPHLIDPGYLIARPVPLGSLRGELRIPTGFNETVLAPTAGGSRIDLRTAQNGRTTYRLTFKVDPADPGAFLRAWDASFGWDMMRYPVITRAAAGRQLYLQGRRFQVREGGASSAAEVPADELPELIRSRFGLDAGLAARALEALRLRARSR
jgi:arylamine N-acetyltransferase